jgi:hypothetical protein
MMKNLLLFMGWAMWLSATIVSIADPAAQTDMMFGGLAVLAFIGHAVHRVADAIENKDHLTPPTGGAKP